jgi:hypothetical protein
VGPAVGVTVTAGVLLELPPPQFATTMAAKTTARSAPELFKKVGTSGLIAALSIRPRFRGLVG